MSGIHAHNRWHDISGYLSFVKGHSYTNDEKFHGQFSSPSYSNSSGNNIGGAQLRLLQRFLQALIILRPRDVLKLSPCNSMAFPVRLTDTQAYTVLEYTALYKQMSGRDSSIVTVERNDAVNSNPLGMAIRGQVYGLHPRLSPSAKDASFDLDYEDVINTTAEGLNLKYNEDTNPMEQRRMWLEQLADRPPEHFDESPHVVALTTFLNHMIRECPEHKLVVVSQYLRYLDIVDTLMKKRYEINSLQFDGTVTQSERVNVQKESGRAGVAKPLLMTAGAGSIGLNLTAGKVVVLVEEWWNQSTEAQVISRCWRQGAKDEVFVIKFHVENSAIDGEISRVRQSKVHTNEALMAPLIHNHDEILQIVELLY